MIATNTECISRYFVKRSKVAYNLLCQSEPPLVGKPVFMPPTLKKLEGHIAFGLSVCVSVCVCVCVLTFER